MWWNVKLEFYQVPHFSPSLPPSISILSVYLIFISLTSIFHYTHLSIFLTTKRKKKCKKYFWAVHKIYRNGREKIEWIMEIKHKKYVRRKRGKSIISKLPLSTFHHQKRKKKGQKKWKNEKLFITLRFVCYVCIIISFISKSVCDTFLNSGYLGDDLHIIGII